MSGLSAGNGLSFGYGLTDHGQGGLSRGSGLSFSGFGSSSNFRITSAGDIRITSTGAFRVVSALAIFAFFFGM